MSFRGQRLTARIPRIEFSGTIRGFRYTQRHHAPEPRLCLTSFPWHEGFRVRATTSSCARRYRAHPRRRCRVRSNVCKARLPHRRDRMVRRLEEVSDDASARVAARAFRTWAIAEGLLVEES